MKIAKYLFLLCTCVACNNNLDDEGQSDRFIDAMIDASRTLTSEDVYDGLVSLEYGASPLVEWKISGSDTLLLVASLQPHDWKLANIEAGESTTTSSSPSEMIWVAIPGEIKSKLQSEAVLRDSTALNMRLIEMLGLRPDGKESIVNLFWINKNSLLRPSYNTTTTTTFGSIDYPSDDELPTWYKEWFEANIEYSYEVPTKGLNYPFSRLGYTYDWGEQKSKYGLSEFVTAPSSNLTVEGKVDCWSYYQSL